MAWHATRFDRLQVTRDMRACAVQEGVHCAVIGIPKSIDNDILLVDRCFGFDTAVEEAQRALQARIHLSGHRCRLLSLILMTLQAADACELVDCFSE